MDRNKLIDIGILGSGILGFLQILWLPYDISLMNLFLLVLSIILLFVFCVLGDK